MTAADKHDIHSLKRYLDYQETPQYRAFRDKENPGSAACNFAVIKSAENLGATLAAIEAFYEGTSIVPRISFGPDSIAPAQCRDFLAHKGYGLCRREVCRMFLTAEPAAGYRVARCKTGPVDVRRSRAAALLLIECCGGQEFGLRLIAKQLAHGARAYAAFDGEDVPVSLCVTEGYGRAARICAENGVPVLDYNTPGGRDIGFDYATDLADHAHVNTAGAQKISTDLAAYLAEHYGMPDKRGDAAYAAWDEAARMEHRDAQNITLRFTLDMAEYFRLLMQDKDLAAVITTQGDATEADPSAPRAVFRQWGLDTLPLEQSGMQGLYVVDGGKVVYQKTGAGPLEYTLSWGGHDVTLRSAVDNSSIAVDGEEQSRNRPGVNVLVYDKVLDRVIQSISFSTLHAYSGYTA